MAHNVVIAGSLAQRPGVGGHAWVFLQYLLGFKTLGWNVLFLDRLTSDMCASASGNTASDLSDNIRYFCHVMDHYGLACEYSLLLDDGRETIGVNRQEVLDRTRSAEMLINVMGFLTDEEILAAARRRVFLDIDPGFGQMWCELRLHDPFVGHTDFVTIGENIGQDGCPIPTCGRKWIATKQPVVLSQWPTASANGQHRITTIASWRGPFGPIEYQGKIYGLRVHEFRRFAELPRCYPGRFELALQISPVETRDLAMLRRNGWSLIDPAVARDPWSYQRYVQDSRAELMVAKNMYVQTRSGWFSDRSICYLASGRPVVAQNTGWPVELCTGAGLLSFDTLEEALAAFGEIDSDYTRHCRAARQLAEDHFSSNVVLPRLVNQILN